MQRNSQISWNQYKILIDRTPKQSVGGSEDGEEGDVDKDEDEDSVMTIDGVEGGYVWL